MFADIVSVGGVEDRRLDLKSTVSATSYVYLVVPLLDYSFFLLTGRENDKLILNENEFVLIETNKYKIYKNK